MFKIQYIHFFLGSLLLAACSHEPISSIITFPETIDETNLDVRITPALSSMEQEKLQTNGCIFNSIELPLEIMLQVFSELPVKDIAKASQVCRAWYQLSEEPALWRTVRLRIHGDYAKNEATKEQAKLHMLRVKVHTLSDLVTMERLINKYELNKHRPFGRYQELAYQLIPGFAREVVDEYAAQWNKRAIVQKIKRLAKGKHGYKENPEAAIAYMGQLADQGNEEAIDRKIDGLDRCKYGYESYESDPEAAVAYNEQLIAQGNKAAIERKIEGLSNYFYGYKKNLEEAFPLIEYWIEQGSEKAIEKKIWGLNYGYYGYEKDGAAAFSFIEHWVKRGNEEAIKAKIKGLTTGYYYGYEKNIEAATEFNEWLIEQGNEEAILRKIKGLNTEKAMNGRELLLYNQNLTHLKNWIEEEISKGTRWACYLKAKGLKYGILGFEKDQEAAIDYIKKYNIPY